ncbi:MAG: hypothetical protein ACI4R8_00595 [Candidatus Caccovivens sp.]
MKNKVNIGIDVDDCICNTLEMDYACACFKMKNRLPKEIDKTYYDVTKTFEMEDGELFYVKEKEYIMKHNSMYPKVFVKEVIKNLRKKGFKIIFITARYDKFWNGKAKYYLKKWLKKFDIQFDEINVNVSNKGEYCINNKIDCLIEDNCENVKFANNYGIKSILIKTSYNQDYKNELNTFAENWLDVYSILAKCYNFDENDLISFE